MEGLSAQEARSRGVGDDSGGDCGGFGNLAFL